MFFPVSPMKGRPTLTDMSDRLEEMQRSNAQPETSQSVAERRSLIKKTHEAEIDKLFVLQAREYRQDALERYQSKDDLVRIIQLEVSVLFSLILCRSDLFAFPGFSSGFIQHMLGFPQDDT